MVESGNTYKNNVSQLISWGHWFSFFNIIAAMLLGTRYITHSGWPETFLGQMYQLLTWVGHFSFLVFAVYILIIFPASFLIPSKKLMRLFAVLVATAGLTLMLLDIFAYETLHLHLNPMVWELLLSGEKTDMNAQWQYLFVGVPAIFFLELALSEWIWRKLRQLSHKHVGVPIAFMFAACFISSHLIHIWADAYLYSPVTSQRSNFPISYPMTAKSFMEKYGLLDRQEYQRRRDEVANKYRDVIRYPLSAVSFSADPTATPQNVLIVMIDSLRADILDPVVMPHLYRFGKENTQFEHHYSSSNDAMAGIFGLFYGLPGSYAHNIRTEGLTPLLINTFEKQKYTLGLFSADNFKNPLYHQSIFDNKDSQSHPIKSQTPWLADKETVEKLEQWLTSQAMIKKETTRRKTAPWFAYLELKNVAHYEKSGQYTRPFQPSLDNELSTQGKHTALLLKNSYNNAAYYVDTLLGQLFETLRENGQLDNTVVLITANHGIEFNETGSNSWGANTNYSQYQLQVPLVISRPYQAPKQIKAFSSHLDIVPTLMEEILWVNTPAKIYSSGQNLFELGDNQRKWVIAGDSRDIVVVQPDQTTVVDKFGNYRVYDSNYKLQPEGKPQLSVLMQVMHEMQRFYYADEK